VKLSTLECLAPLLDELRRHPALHEVRPTVFHVNRRNFLHFHDDDDGIYADIRLARGFLRLPASTSGEQAELLSQIDERLGSLDAHVIGRRRKHRGQRRGSGAP